MSAGRKGEMIVAATAVPSASAQDSQEHPRSVRQAVIVFDQEKQALAAVERLWKLKSFSGETFVGPEGGRFVVKFYAERPVRISAVQALGGKLTVLDRPDERQAQGGPESAVDPQVSERKRGRRGP